MVHEWIARSGGSENVLQAMSNTFPTSEIYCLWNDAPKRFADRVVKESFLARTPLRKNKAAALPFMPMVWSSVHLESYDWALVSSHLFAHHVGSRKSRINTKIFAYIHTPARYIWVPELDIRGQSAVGRRISPFFQRSDRKRASEGAAFAANSNFIRQRIRDTWDQDSRVIYPPVAISKLQSHESWADLVTSSEARVLSSLPPEYVMGASRFVAYKQLDKVIAAGESVGLPVVLAGAGPEEAFLRNVAQNASVPVIFVKSPSDALLFALIQRAQVFVFPPVEDFGILPVEAMALGTPVVVNAVGGAVESVDALNGGSAVTTFNGTEIAEALSSAIAKDMTEATSKAAIFSEESFSANLREWMSV